MREKYLSEPGRNGKGAEHVGEVGATELREVGNAERGMRSAGRRTSPNNSLPKAEREGAEDWGRLVRETVEFAQSQIDRWYWRGAKGGVLPGGYDAESVAADAMAAAVEGGWLRVESDQERGSSADKDCEPLALSVSLSNEAGVTCTPEELERRLKGVVLRLIDRLRHRKEPSVVRNDGDLSLKPLSNCNQGEMGSVLEALPAAGMDPGKEAFGTEEREIFGRFKEEFSGYLGQDEQAKVVFMCMCDAVTKPAKIAAELGLPVREVKSARKRLARRLAEFAAKDGTGVAQAFIRALRL